jgi:succinoglycan biosynthesis protein ExoA
LSQAPEKVLAPAPQLLTYAVTVIVAARNEEDFIEECVHSLLEMDAPAGGFEVIVAEGNSSDRTRSVLDRLVTENDRLRVVENPRQIAPAAWNVAIRAARGDYVAIMGAHARYPRDYIVRCLEFAKKTKADNVGGPAIAEGKGYLQRANAASHHSPFSVGGASWHSLDYEGPARTVFGGFFRRDLFERVGYFDEELVRDSDAEFNFRLELKGGSIYQSPSIHSWYQPRASTLALFKQYRQYGYWKVRIMQKHGRTPAIRQYVPAVFVAGMVALVAAAFTTAIVGAQPLATITRDALLAVLASYALLLIVGSVTTAARYGWSLLPILPLTFASYHAGYGVGFLTGIYDFLIRQRTRGRAGMSELTR